VVRALRTLALLLAFLLTPGSSAMVESAVHLVADGHLAHALDDEEHAPEAEHGCTPVMHTCACHGCPAVTLRDALPSQPGSLQRTLEAGSAVGHRPSAGHGTRVERPPTA